MPIKIGGEELFDNREAAQQLGISQDTVRYYHVIGKIEGEKIGNKWYHTAAQIARMREKIQRPEKSGPKPKKNNEDDTPICDIHTSFATVSTGCVA